MLTRRFFLKTGGIALFTLGVGGGPGFITRAALAAQGTPSTSSRRRKVLVAIFQRGAMDGLAAVPPVDDSTLKGLRPRLAMSGARAAGDEALLDLGPRFGLHPPPPPPARGPRRRRRGPARPRHRLRPPPRPGAAAAAVEGQAAGHRPRRGLPRPHALALRRPGLPGDRPPGPQGDPQRLAQPRRGADGP